MTNLMMRSSVVAAIGGAFVAVSLIAGTAAAHDYTTRNGAMIFDCYHGGEYRTVRREIVLSTGEISVQWEQVWVEDPGHSCDQR